MKIPTETNLGVEALVTHVDCPKGKMILDSGGVRLIKMEEEMKVVEALRLLQEF